MYGIGNVSGVMCPSWCHKYDVSGGLPHKIMEWSCHKSDGTCVLQGCVIKQINGTECVTVQRMHFVIQFSLATSNFEAI